MKIYMAVTKDALSLPLAVADSAAELAELRGVQVETIRSLVSRGRTHPERRTYPERRMRHRKRRRATGAGRAENLTGRYSGKESDYCGRRAA